MPSSKLTATEENHLMCEFTRAILNSPTIIAKLECDKEYTYTIQFSKQIAYPEHLIITASDLNPSCENEDLLCKQ